MEYILHYFDVRGRAEPIRLLFHYTKTLFNDVRIPKQEWRAKKQTFPFGQVPVLETKDKTQIAQSYAIARFLANKNGLAGKDPVEAAKVDGIADLYKDFIAEVAPYLHRKPNADKEQLKKDLFEPALKRFFPMFEKILKESGSGFLVASGVTWADMFFAEGIQSLKNVEPEALNGHSLLVQHQERVHALPGIKEYVATRPHSDF